MIARVQMINSYLEKEVIRFFGGKVQYFAEEMMKSFIRNIRILKLGKMFEKIQQTISIVLSSCKNRNYRN